MKDILINFWLIWARTIDHRVGLSDDQKPEIPNLKMKYAHVSLMLRTLIVLINFITCGFIIANVIHHW